MYQSLINTLILTAAIIGSVAPVQATVVNPPPIGAAAFTPREDGGIDALIGSFQNQSRNRALRNQQQWSLFFSNVHEQLAAVNSDQLFKAEILIQSAQRLNIDFTTVEGGGTSCLQSLGQIDMHLQDMSDAELHQLAQSLKDFIKIYCAERTEFSKLD